jgi:tetratricopeptide (TPR) repeat protein
MVLVLEPAAGGEKKEPGLRGSFQKGFTGLSAAVKDKDRFPDGWAYFSFSDKAYPRALADFETAIKLVPTESVFYRDRGNVALAGKDYDKALADYDKSIQLDPSYVVPWHLRGVTWQAKKEYAKALADYEKAVQLAGNAPYASTYHSALALLRAGCPEATIRDGGKALEAAQKAHTLAKGPAEMAALAAAHAELGQFDKAVEWQEKAIATAPEGAKEPYREWLKKYQDRKPYRLD